MSHRGHEQVHHSSHHNAEHSDEWVKQKDDEVRISAKAMDITWGNEDRFWRWVNFDNDQLGFKGGFELIQVCYLNVTGELDLSKYSLKHDKTYEIWYAIKFNVDAFGWDGVPISFELIIPDELPIQKYVNLEGHRKKNDQWCFIHGGEFKLKNTKEKLWFSMREVESNYWKGGLIIEGVMIKAK